MALNVTSTVRSDLALLGHDEPFWNLFSQAFASVVLTLLFSTRLIASMMITHPVI